MEGEREAATNQIFGNKELGDRVCAYPNGRIDLGQLSFHLSHSSFNRFHSTNRLCSRTWSSCGDGSWNRGVLARKLATLATM